MATMILTCKKCGQSSNISELVDLDLRLIMDDQANTISKLEKRLVAKQEVIDLLQEATVTLRASISSGAPASLQAAMEKANRLCGEASCLRLTEHSASGAACKSEDEA